MPCLTRPSAYHSLYDPPIVNAHRALPLWHGQIQLYALHDHFDACHCSMCRRWSAGPALAIQADGEPDTEGKSAVIVYKSSEWGERHFCGRCGTNLFWRAPDYGYHGVSVGAVDDIEGLAFAKEIFVDHKPSQYAFANDTLLMTEAEVAALFAEPEDGDSGGDGDGDG